MLITYWTSVYMVYKAEIIKYNPMQKRFRITQKFKARIKNKILNFNQLNQLLGFNIKNRLVQLSFLDNLLINLAAQDYIFLHKNWQRIRDAPKPQFNTFKRFCWSYHNLGYSFAKVNKYNKCLYKKLEVARFINDIKPFKAYMKGLCSNLE